MLRTPWPATWLGAAALTIGWIIGAPWVSPLGLILTGMFIGAEWLAVFDGVPGNTMSEGVWKEVPPPPVRWALGVWLGVLIMATVHPVLGVLVCLWLPIHWGARGFEKRVFNG